MSAGLILIRHSLKRVRLLVGGIAILLAAFQVLLTLVSASVHTSGGFDQLTDLMPDFVRALMGPSIVVVMSFGGLVCVGYFHVAVMGSLVGLTIGLCSELASEIESGFMDLILSRPLGRHWIITRSIAVVVLCTTIVLGAMTIGTWVGLHTLAPEGPGWPSAKLIGSLVLNLGVLMISWGGITLAISAHSRRRIAAGSIAGVLALATFLLDYLARAWEPAESIAWLSPFRYYSPLDLLLGRKIPDHHLFVLAGIGVSGFALAYLLFSKRDI